MIESVIDFAQPVVQQTKCYPCAEHAGALSQKLAAATPYRPSGVVMSVPGGGVNSNVDGGTGARV